LVDQLSCLFRDCLDLAVVFAQAFLKGLQASSFLEGLLEKSRLKIVFYFFFSFTFTFYFFAA